MVLSQVGFLEEVNNLHFKTRTSQEKIYVLVTSVLIRLNQMIMCKLQCYHMKSLYKTKTPISILLCVLWFQGFIYRFNFTWLKRVRSTVLRPSKVSPKVIILQVFFFFIFSVLWIIEPSLVALKPVQGCICNAVIRQVSLSMRFRVSWFNIDFVSKSNHYRFYFADLIKLLFIPDTNTRSRSM